MGQDQTSGTPPGAVRVAIAPAEGLGVRTVPDGVGSLLDAAGGDETETAGVSDLVVEREEGAIDHDRHRHVQAVYASLVRGLRRLRPAGNRRR